MLYWHRYKHKAFATRATFLLVILAACLTSTPHPLSAQDTPSEVGKVDDIGEVEDVKDADLKSDELKRPSRAGEPTYVKIRVYVVDIDEVNSANQSFSGSIYYEARWYNPLLRHQGPGPKIRRMTEVWTPRLVITNQQQAWSAFPAFVEISPEGEVSFRQKTWGWFSQPLNLKNFPLDQQTLTIHLAAVGSLESEVKLVAFEGSHGRRSGVKKSFSLPDFDVLSWKAVSQPYTPFEGEIGVPGYRMEINIKRRPSYYILKIIFPLCLIVIMSLIPRWLDPKEAGSSISISTTSFLTLVAYLFATTVLLPKVSYLTRMDYFILLSTLLVFLGLLQTATSAYLIRRGNFNEVERADRWSRFVYPLLLILVLAFTFV